MRKQRRVSGARLVVWTAALKELRRHRRQVFSLALSLALVAAVLNLPVFPEYQRGLATGAIIVGLAWATTWMIWVPSGLSLRLNGAWAEDATNELLKEHPRIFGVVPSMKFGKSDIDAVAVSRAGVLAVETKWMLRPDVARLNSFADQAMRGCRTLRLSLKGQGLRDESFVAVLAIWGPASEGLRSHARDTPLGQVWVTRGAELATVIDELAPRPIGPDFAHDLIQHLEHHALGRDAAQEQPSRLVRRLAQIK